MTIKNYERQILTLFGGVSFLRAQKKGLYSYSQGWKL